MIVIPFRLTIIALLFYNLIIYLLFNSLNPTEINYILGVGSYWHHIFWIGIGVPYFISFISMYAVSSVNSNALASLIRFRNGQMSISPDKTAFEIFRRTAVLDAMQQNEGTEIYEKAIQGFNALHSAKSPQSVFKEMTKDD